MNECVSFRQGGHKPTLAEFRRLGVGESKDEILDDGGEWWLSKLMKAIRQLQIAWMLVAFLVLQGFGQDVKPPPSLLPPKPLPLPKKIIPKSVSDENSSGNDDELKLTRIIKGGRTIKIPPRIPELNLDWSDFIYNSPEEKAFWDKLPDWSDKVLVESRFISPGAPIINKRNAQGETIESNSSEGYDGYVKKKSGSTRTIYQFVDGYAVRSKSCRKYGKKRWERNYKEGKQDGIETWWYENGQKSSERNYKDGKRDGLETSWYENGQKSSERNYKDGKRDGLVTIWYENGQKDYEENWKDGEKDGLWTWWYENGQKKRERNYKDGKLDGLETWWSVDRQKSSERNYKDGTLVDNLKTEWYKNGQKKEEGNYKDGKISQAKVWLPDGKECPESKVIDGNGTLVTYSLDGKEIGRRKFKLGWQTSITQPASSESNATTRPKFRLPRSQPPLKLTERL